ncbi:MAG: hypothetical protein ACMUIA_09115 [bacterium]
MERVFRVIRYGIILSIISFFPSHIALARQMPYFWKGIRPLGMGGAFTAIADDHNALFYNPAGLDKIVRPSFAVLNPLIEIGEEGQDLYHDIHSTDLDDSSEVSNLLRDYMGSRQHVRSALFPHFVRKHYGFGILAHLGIDAEVNNLQYPEVNTSAALDIAGVGGLGFSFLTNHALRLGLSAKYIQRQKIEETYTAVQISSHDFEDIIEDDLMEGSGFGFDLGAMYTFPLFLEPTVALVIQNIGGIDLDEAGEIPQQINLGTAIHYENGPLSLQAGMDFMDVMQEVNEHEDDFFRRLHLGTESCLWNRLSLRIGLYQGYGSFGLGLNLWILKLDYANYAEELGAYAGQRADRRHTLQISLGW